MDGEGLDSHPESPVVAAVAEQLSYTPESLVGSNTVTSPSPLPFTQCPSSQAHTNQNGS